MNDDEVNINLSKDEALVLFEFLSRFSNNEILKIEHQAEERALWNLLCNLEQKLHEPLTSEYEKLLIEARDRLTE